MLGLSPTASITDEIADDETKNTSDFIVASATDPSPIEPKTPLTKKQKKVRAKNKLAKASRKKNRN